MNYTELQSMVILAIDKLHDFDSALLRLNSSEWSLSHRLAVYLEQLVRGWDVDCEYNRQGQYKDIKKRSNGCRIRPDINIHHRGHVESVHNLLVIEVKINETESDSEKVCSIQDLQMLIADFSISSVLPSH